VANCKVILEYKLHSNAHAFEYLGHAVDKGFTLLGQLIETIDANLRFFTFRWRIAFQQFAALDEGDLGIDFLLKQQQVFTLLRFVAPFQVIGDDEHDVIWFPLGYCDDVDDFGFGDGHARSLSGDCQLRFP
jgi:hypothetical protein